MKAILRLAALLLVSLVTQAYAGAPLVQLGVFDRAEGRELPLHWHEGRAYVVGRPGNEYRLVVTNRSAEEVLAVVSVDGVNVITGATASPHQPGYVLAPGGRLEIQGWRKSLSQTAAFYFTSLADSYAARTGRPDNVGVIGVAVFRKKAVEPAPIGRTAPQARREAAESGPGASADEAAAPSAAEPAPRERASGTFAPDAARLGTGHGRRESSPARYVSFERATREPAQVLSVYYDSHRNLVARGVIRAPVAPLPQPFPGFVPDPQIGYVTPRCGGFAPPPAAC